MSRTRDLRSPFLDPAAPSLADVLMALEAKVPDARRRGELRSAINSLCRVLGRLPHELPADTALLGRLIRKALASSGLAIMPGRRLHPLTPAWAELDQALPTRYARAMLSRLMRWCSAQGIAPGEVDQVAIERLPSGQPTSCRLRPFQPASEPMPSSGSTGSSAGPGWMSGQCGRSGRPRSRCGALHSASSPRP
jgi:hypothetical protein